MVLLSQFERTLISAILAEPGCGKKSNIPLKTLCVVHKIRVKKIAADDLLLLTMLKTAVRDSLREVAHPRRHLTAGWRRWFEPYGSRCSLCTQLSSQDRVLCHALIRCLGDTDFWKGFQRAPLLCSDHLEKCLGAADKGVGLERLRNDQSAKLNELLDDLIRFEATGTHGECKSTALSWLADFAAPALDAGNADASFAAEAVPAELTSEAHPDSLAGRQQDQEHLAFEKEKLARKVRDLMERLSELETIAAALHYRVARLSEDNRRLEMGYTGANTQADGLKQLVQDLREEIQQLKNGGAERTAKAAS